MTDDTRLGAERVEIVVKHRCDLPQARTILDVVAVGEVQIDDEQRLVSAAVEDGLESLGAALHQLHVSAVEIIGVRLRRETPDDDVLCGCSGAER